MQMPDFESRDVPKPGDLVVVKYLSLDLPGVVIRRNDLAPPNREYSVLVVGEIFAFSRDEISILSS